MRERIEEDLKAAMKAREGARVSTLRMLLNALKGAEKDKREPLSDEEALDVLSREAKRRRESIEAFEKGGRRDLVDKERAELDLIAGYLPQPLSGEELARIVDETIAEVGASGPKDMGGVMKAVMPKVRGRAEGGAVSALVRARLGA